MADADNKLIEQLEFDWRDALCSKDMDRLQSMLHKDFVLIGTRSTGAFLMTRDDWLDAIQHRDVQDVDVKIHDATVLDDVLVGTIQASWKLNYLGRTIEDCVVATDVWVNEAGRWQALRRHSTPAPSGACIETGE